MKKLFLFAAILMISLFSINNAKAQVSININIGSQPVWGPTGYDHVDYYYFPDIDSYYYVPSGQYIYSNNGRWIWVNSLPSQFGNFDLYSAYKVVVNEPRPYLRNNVYVAKYSKFKNYNGRQSVIRDSHDTKYYVVKGHPNYNGNNNSATNRRTENNGNVNRGNQGNGGKQNQQTRPTQNKGNQGNGGKQNQQARPTQNSGNNEKGNNNRPQRDNKQKNEGQN